MRAGLAARHAVQGSDTPLVLQSVFTKRHNPYSHAFIEWNEEPSYLAATG